MKAGLEGEKYLGFFEADQKKGCTKIEGKRSTTYWYEGQGAVRDKQTGKEVSFALKTSSYKSKEYNLKYTLKECICDVDISHYFHLEPPVANRFFEQIADLVLEDMLSQAGKSPSNPVTPKKLDKDDLAQALKQAEDSFLG